MKKEVARETVASEQSVPRLRTDEAGGSACLVIIHPPEAGKGLVQIPQGKFVIGREESCDLDLDDEMASRRHACIEADDSKCTISDLGSRNGTYVNDERIGEKVLATGDFVRIGIHVMKFLCSEHIEAQYHETIYSMMITDGLTGIYNKRFFLDALERELSRSLRHNRPLSLVIFDIDHFKRINDTHGHPAGDEVLRKLGKRIGTAIRRHEVFARYGGEEFVVLLPEFEVDSARAFGERLCSTVRQEPIAADDKEIPVTISVGVAHTMGDRTMTLEQLIAEADRKLYEAKRSGRDRVCG